MKKHTFTFTPEICQPRKVTVKAPGPDGVEVETESEAPAAYEGTVTMRRMTYAQRIGFSEDVPDLPKDPTPEQRHKYSVRLMGIAMERAAKFIESIEIKRLSDGFVFSDYDDLQYDTDMSEVVLEIVSKLADKYTVGNAPRPS